MRLTLVIPTYNEAQNLRGLVSALFALPAPPERLIIVDDNSPDGTGALADELAGEYPGRIQVIHRPGKLGLGTAYLQGFRQALESGAEAIGQMDADFSHPVAAIPGLLAALDEVDVAMGSRYVPGGGVDRDWSAWRKFLSAFGNWYARLILRLPVRDATGGMRLWRRSALAALPLERVRSNGYAFQVEMTYLAHRLGLRLRELPIYFEDRHQGHSKMSFAIQREAALRVWQMLWQYRDL